jgi:hypothetical protein
VLGFFIGVLIGAALTWVIPEVRKLLKDEEDYY